MNTRYIDKKIIKSFKSFLIKSMVLLAAIAVIALSIGKDCYNLMSGPSEVTMSELNTLIQNPGSKSKIVTVTTWEIFDPKLMKSNPGKTASKEKEYKLITAIDKFVVILTDAGNTDTTFTGKLVPLKKDIKERLAGEMLPGLSQKEIDKVLSPLSLDTTSSRNLTLYILLGVEAILTVLLLFFAIRYFYTTGQKKKLSNKNLEHYGNISEVKNSIDSEISSGNKAFGDIMITQNWYIYNGKKALEFAKLDEIVLAYMETNHGKKDLSYVLNIILQDGRCIKSIFSDSQYESSEAAGSELKERMPWIVYGSSIQIMLEYQDNKEALISEIMKKKQEYKKSISA